jgi:hypothetical protein
MSVRLTWQGLTELRTALRNLPADLAAEGGQIVASHAERAFSTVQGQYTAVAHSGTLAARLREAQEPGAMRFGVVYSVSSRAPHAWMYEHGTKRRQTANGANRGVMPAAHVFVTEMQRERRLMYHELAELLRRAGFEVSGDAA